MPRGICRSLVPKTPAGCAGSRNAPVRGAPRFCFAQEASLGLQQLSACSQAICLFDQRGDLGGTAYAARNMSVPGAQVSLCAGSISGPAADLCMLPSHSFSRSKRGFGRDGLCRKIKTRIVQAGCRGIRYESPWTDACQRRNHRNAGLWPPALAGPCCNLTIRPFGSSTT